MGGMKGSALSLVWTGESQDCAGLCTEVLLHRHTFPMHPGQNLALASSVRVTACFAGRAFSTKTPLNQCKWDVAGRKATGGRSEKRLWGL